MLIKHHTALLLFKKPLVILWRRVFDSIKRYVNVQTQRSGIC